MYNVTIDPAAELVHATLGGMMTVEEVGEYISEIKRQFVLNRMRSYVMIIDVSGCPIQSQEMIKAMGGHMATMPKAKRIAVVVGSSLAKMQVRRLFTQPYCTIVANLEQARHWVFEATQEAASAG